MNRILISVITLLLAGAGVQAQDHKYDYWDKNYTVQALLGAVQYDKLKFEDTSGGGTPVEVDVSLMPQLGGAWGTMPQEGERFQYGLECSFLLGFIFDKVNYAYAGSGGAYISISTRMWMFDLAGGPYANLWLNDSVRLYAGGGPLLTYADYNSERTETPTGGTDEIYDNRDTVFGMGVYARAGVEFQVHERGYLGLGARASWAHADFTEVGGSSEVNGMAVFVSYTAGL